MENKMSNLNYLLRYVRSGTAEGDRQFLAETFVSPSQFGQLCSIEPGSMRVLVGNKGIGKSAIVEWIDKVAKRRNLPAVLLRPDNLADTGQPHALDIGTLKAHYYDKLLRSVASTIGSKLKHLLIGSAAKLYNEAKRKGISQEDLVTKTLELVSAVSLPVKNVNGVQLAKDLAGTNSHDQLVQAINTQLLQPGSSVFFLLIDDTDQLASPDQGSHLNRIWALILAVRRLAIECPNVRPIVTLRSSVWSRLTSESSGQRDQTDHIRGFVVPLLATDDLMTNIVERRLLRATMDAGASRSDLYGNFFDSYTMTLPSSDERRSWPSFITKSARERPRDALQLIKSMIDAATSAKHAKIGSADAANAMTIYSGERVDDIVNEFSLDCAAVRNVIDSFSDEDFDLKFESVRDHLRRVPSITSMAIRGTQLHPDSDEDAIRLLGLLHETGFLNARVPDKTKPRGFRHINFGDDPNFVRFSNWNSLQGATWEVHPAFRSYLIGVRTAKLSRRNT
jgi:hypothetical protein